MYGGLSFEMCGFFFSNIIFTVDFWLHITIIKADVLLVRFLLSTSLAKTHKTSTINFRLLLVMYEDPLRWLQGSVGFWPCGIMCNIKCIIWNEWVFLLQSLYGVRNMFCGSHANSLVRNVGSIRAVVKQQDASGTAELVYKTMLFQQCSFTLTFISMVVSWTLHCTGKGTTIFYSFHRSRYTYIDI